MKKRAYHISVNKGGGVMAKPVSGYAVEKEVCGKTFEFGIRKDKKSWTVDDIGTGMSVCSVKLRTRAAALEYVDGSLGRLMADFIEKKPLEYEAAKDALEILVARGFESPWPRRERSEYIDGRMRELAGEQGAANDGAGAEECPALSEKPKRKAKKQAAKKQAAKENAKETVAKSGKVAEQAIEVSLDTMKKWCAEREDVVATQKREGCAIWVDGVTKPHQDELRGMGFRWSPKRKGWYYRAA